MFFVLIKCLKSFCNIRRKNLDPIFYHLPAMTLEVIELNEDQAAR
jgi:hypothetical protein